MQKPLVSIIIIFLNAERFIDEAIQSVMSQTYTHWELLLVDDGSTDSSTQIAKRYADQHAGQVHYLEHDGHRNRGMSPSRNLGIRHAQGGYVAFLDADDLWLPTKLEDQVQILAARPDVDMLYGNTKYWYSWTQGREADTRDFVPALGIKPNSVIEPPNLLPQFLRGQVAVPCTCSILVRRNAAEAVGNFDERFAGNHNLYEDQAFYAKLCLTSRVYVSDRCWDWYRQHPNSSIAVAQRQRREQAARQYFLNWLEEYLRQQQVSSDEVWQALRREQWLNRTPTWLAHVDHAHTRVRWAKKWLLRVGEAIFPAFIQAWMWKLGCLVAGIGLPIYLSIGT